MYAPVVDESEIERHFAWHGLVSPNPDDIEGRQVLPPPPP